MSGRAADAKVYLSVRHRVCHAPSAGSDPAPTAARSRIGCPPRKSPSGGWALGIRFRVTSRRRLTDAFDGPVRCTPADCSPVWSLVMPKLVGWQPIAAHVWVTGGEPLRKHGNRQDVAAGTMIAITRGVALGNDISKQPANPTNPESPIPAPQASAVSNCPSINCRPARNPCAMAS